MAKKIFVVDDKHDTADMVSFILKKEGYEVTTCYNGKDCVAKLNKNPADLVLLDLMMPDMDGMKVLEKITENDKLKSIKVIFLTAIDRNPSSTSLLYQDNVAGYLIKPADKPTILEKVKAALGE